MEAEDDLTKAITLKPELEVKRKLEHLVVVGILGGGIKPKVSKGWRVKGLVYL